jgi:methionine-rich copper-binding protein CopC
VHSALVSVVPADRSVLDRGPSEIVLTFNEDIAPSFAQVAVSAEAAGSPPLGSGSGSGAGVVATSPVAVSGRVARVTLTPPGPGAYRIAYRVVSADGHPISGESTFAVRGSAVPSTGPGASGSPTTSPTAAVPTASAPGIPPTEPSGGADRGGHPAGLVRPRRSADARRCRHRARLPPRGGRCYWQAWA